MKLLLFAFLLSGLIASTVAWTKEDYEIFDIVSALEGAEGKGTTFYSWLDVPSTASSADISRAYRKKSLELHPDKNPGVRGIHERFARLGVVAQILRDAEARERYNFFYKNGVPKWRGTGYYYSRFRPGLVTVATFLVILTTILQYVVQSMNYKRDIARIRRLVSQAQSLAWGPKGVPIEGSRKVKVPLTEEQGGRMVDMLVVGDQVFLTGDDTSGPVPLDESVAPKPAWTRTWLPALTLPTLKRIVARLDAPALPREEPETEESDAATGAAATEVPNGTSTGVRKPASAAAAAMAGGRRRKGVKAVKRKPKDDSSLQASAESSDASPMTN